jgi:signal transduction histidine kinase
VDVPRPALLCLICGAVENAIENIRANGGSGRLELRASGTDTEVLIEVTDDGYPNATDLRATFLDSLLVNSGTARLRQLRERVRSMDGEMTVDADRGTVLSLYLPLGAEQAAVDSRPRPVKLQLVRRDR